MKRALLFTGLLSLAALGLAWNNFPLSAQLPSETISFSARLLDASGQPLNAASIGIVVSIYDVPTGGAALFSETQTLSVTNGLLALAIGATQPLPATLFSDLSQRYVGIRVGSDGEMSPRIPLTSVPFANVAQTALTTLAGGGLPAGAISLFGGSLPPTGFLLCDGAPVSRSQYSALFAAIGTTYGAGDGSTTFNLPDLRQRFPLGRGLNGTGSSLGSAGGQIDHTHQISDHSHTLPAHTHDMSSHMHSVTAHSHGFSTIASVPGHSHDAQGPGATINILEDSASKHVHNIDVREGVDTGGYSKSNRVKAAQIFGGEAKNWNLGTSNFGEHVHVHSSIVGTVGNASDGINGDNSINIVVSGTSASAGDGLTGGPSVGLTGANSVGLVTNGTSSAQSGVQNPPFLTVNFIIKA
jgi:microcystin-dependent protein